jgi:hypothetical protein
LLHICVVVSSLACDAESVSEREPEQLVRDSVAAGQSLGEIAADLRREGIGPLEAVKALSHGAGIRLAEAKLLVDRSLSSEWWETNERLRATAAESLELDQVQATYDKALRRVMTDLTETTDLRPSVIVDFTDPGEVQYWYHPGDSSCHGSSLYLDDDEESATVTLAELIQDDVLEDLWGPTWPVCPGHSHPAEPTLQDGQATWVCPRSYHRLATIGTLSR